jgi:sialic acid synthase SpsE
MKSKLLFENNGIHQEKFIKPFIIAEAGVNHENSMDVAFRLVDEAQEGGADAIKFQSYKAETLASKHSPAYWNLSEEPVDSQYRLFKKHDKFWKKEFEEIKLHCERCGIEFLSTPFDLESALFLNSLMDTFKISSSDITNYPFIDYICRFKKPIILSTGASYMYEIERALSWIQKYDNPLALMHCVLEYPTPNESANLGMIVDLQNRYPEYLIGYSDHTVPGDMKICEIAVLLGANIIEKHFTHDKTLKGNDHYHAMDVNDLKYFNSKLEQNNRIIGSYKKSALPSEQPARDNARRSLVAKRDIPQNKNIEEEDLTFKRPGGGISPANIEEVIGTRARDFISEDEVIVWTSIK